MQASHCARCQPIQGWEGPGDGLGKQAAGEEKARLRWTEVSRTQTYRQNHEEIDVETEVS